MQEKVDSTSLNVLSQRYPHKKNDFRATANPLSIQLDNINKQLETSPLASKSVHDVIYHEMQNENYSCFYQAMDYKIFLFSFFTESLYRALHENKKEQYPDNYQGPFLRPPMPDLPRTIPEFFKLHPPPDVGDGFLQGDEGMYDWGPEVRKQLLSVNPTLFSNAIVDGGGECTWNFYWDNRSVATILPYHFLPSLLAQYNLVVDEEHLKKLGRLYNELDECASSYHAELVHVEDPLAQGQSSPKGVLLQILIPHDQVDEIVYPCYKAGIKCNFPPNTFGAATTSFHEAVQSFAGHQGDSAVARKQKRKEEEIDLALYKQMALQGRLLIQRVMGEKNVKTIIHGYGQFFSSQNTPILNTEDSLKPNKKEKITKNLTTQTKKINSIEKTQKCQDIIKKKEQIINEINGLFREIIAASALGAEEKIQRTHDISTNEKRENDDSQEVGKVEKATSQIATIGNVDLGLVDKIQPPFEEQPLPVESLTTTQDIPERIEQEIEESIVPSGDVIFEQLAVDNRTAALEAHDSEYPVQILVGDAAFAGGSAIELFGFFGVKNKEEPRDLSPNERNLNFPGGKIFED